MDRETLSHYGWIVILVLILAVLLALATPFGNFVAEGFKATYAGFGMVSDNALGVAIPGAETHEPNTLYYYQPYAFDFGGGQTAEVVFHKDGAYDIYYNDNGYEWGEVFTTENPAIYGEGTVEFFGVVYNISEDGNHLTADGQPSGTLVPTPIHALYMNTGYVCKDSDDWKYTLLFRPDGSGVYKEYYQGVENYNWDIPVSNYKYFDEYFEEHYYDEYDGQTYINRHAVYPNGQKVIDYGDVYKIDCQHLNTEIRNKSDEYTGDEYCKDCGELIKEGSPIVPGLYDKDWNLVADWDTLVNEYGVDFSRDDSFSEGYAGELHRVMHNNEELQIGVTLLMSDELTHIGSYSLYSDAYPTYIKRIIIGKNVKSIGQGAFIDLETLTRVDIPDGLETIGWGAFMGCSGLAEINVPESVTTLAAHAFSDCTNLTKVNIPNNITEVSLGLFEGCTSLSNIYLREGITTIHEYAFERCTSLRELNIPSTVNTIDEDAFRGSGLVSIVIPNGITEISEMLFYNCTNLSSVTLPDTVTSIGKYAFEGCTSLRTLDLPDGLTYIAEYAFKSCGLTSLDIPDGVTILLNYTFQGCKNLETVKLPSNLIRINYDVFTDSGLKSIVIPASTQEINKRAFKNCTKLTNVVFEDPNGWQVNTANAFGNYTSAITVNLSSASQNGYYLRSTYTDYFWKNVS